MGASESIEFGARGLAGGEGKKTLEWKENNNKKPERGDGPGRRRKKWNVLGPFVVRRWPKALTLGIRDRLVAASSMCSGGVA